MLNDISKEAAIFDLENVESRGKIVGCYCYNKVKSVEDFKDIQDVKALLVNDDFCIKWLTSYLYEQISPYFSAFAISTINII